jgi:hypothetical protein
VNLLDLTRRCCDDLLADARLGSVAEQISTRRAELDERLRVAVAGQISAGKSTLVNALVGRNVAETGTSETTEINAWFQKGAPERVIARRVSGHQVEIPLDEAGHPTGQLPPDLDRDHAAPLVYVLDAPLLEDFTIIDTPGLFSPNREKSARAEAVMAKRSARAAIAANALIYLTQELPGAATDTRQLAAFNSLFGGLGSKAPTNSVLVLSRIDERWDPHGTDERTPYEIADALVARHGAELWRRVWTTRPVLGHLAEQARTGRGPDDKDVADLVALSRQPQRRRMIAGKRRLSGVDVPEVPVDRRLALLERFGDWGLYRLLEIVAAGVNTPEGLTEALLEESGLPPILSLVGELFRERADLIRSESVLSGLERVALHGEAGRAGAEVMLAAVERVRISDATGELARLQVIRLVTDPDDRRLRLSDGARREVRLLLGGGSPHERLGAPLDTPPAELAAIARRRMRAWRSVENQTPVSPTRFRVASAAASAYGQLERELTAVVGVPG